MNKQEVIEKIKSKKSLENCLSNYGLGYNEALDEAIYIINQIDEFDEPVRPSEPEKPTVPQCVADFISSEQRSCSALSEAIDNMEMRDEGEVTGWFYDNSEAFAKAWLYGYEVDKEKLYRVELPNPNGDSNRYGLCKVDGRIIIGSFVFGLNKAINTKLTEAEIKKDFEWAWQFAKEVEE